MNKGTKLYSILRRKCPQCNEGEFFISHPYNLKRIGDTHESCENCNLKYEREPGFYYGAMFVSYGLGVMVFVGLWALLNFAFVDVHVGWQIAFILVSIVLLGPYLYALSKIIWINMFVKYDKDATNKN
jgi:uncharacterized protein (DUF983 family)